jgi:hypothetical protein
MLAQRSKHLAEAPISPGGAARRPTEKVVMERKVVCDLNLISVDFGREEELQPGNTFRITFRHVNGERTGAIEVYQGEAEHFAVELEAVAAFLPAALIATKKTKSAPAAVGRLCTIDD